MLFESFKEAIDIKDLNWNKDSRTFSAEISELRNVSPGAKEINVVNKDTNKTVKFTFVSTDKDGSGEDTYGWNYENKEMDLKLLVIND